jgi:hypothetical protein
MIALGLCFRGPRGHYRMVSRGRLESVVELGDDALVHIETVLGRIWRRCLDALECALGGCIRVHLETVHEHT